MITLENLRDLVDVTGAGCWEWKRFRDRQGYGVCGKQGGTARVHRIVFALANGSIRDGSLVLHDCDNPPCCNPAHLRLGTHAENQKQKANRGRSLRGEGNAASRLTAEAARAIVDDSRPFAVIALEHGVTAMTVCRIKAGQGWQHATGLAPVGLARRAGTRHRAAKLTAEQVRAIRSSGEGPSVVMRRYGISHTAATRVIKGISYADIE